METPDLEQQLPPRERLWLRWARRTGWALVGLYFLAALILLTARYLVVPEIPKYRTEIVEALSRTLGARVAIDSIVADWHGFHPRVELGGVRLFDQAGNEALELPKVRAVVAWRSLLSRAVRLRSLEIDRADLVVRRDAAGKFYVAGLPVDSESADSGAADWLLRQGEIHVRSATVQWLDEKRGAPNLRLEEVGFLMRNSGDEHEFALSARPPAEYGKALDVRGTLQGGSAEKLEEWEGDLYVGFADLDLAAWQKWVDYPLAVRSGRGALRLWLTVAERGIEEAHTQVALTNVALRLAPELPELQLRRLQGELGLERTQQGALSLMGFGDKAVYEAYARKLELETTDGLKLQAADLAGSWQSGGEAAAANGKVQAARVDLHPLAVLSDHFPMPAKVRAFIQASAPRGHLDDARFDWSGSIEAPRTYRAQAKFADLGLAPHAGIPGFGALSGTLDISDAGGRVDVAGKQFELRYPGVLADDRIPVDALAARVNWAMAKGVLDLRIENATLQNAELDAQLSGSIKTTPQARTVVDLTGRASRGHGPAIYKYIPALPEEVKLWLRESILAGKLSDGQMRLRGDLHDFPFTNPKTGEFRLAAELSDVRLRYAPDWPEFTALDGDLLFQGKELIINADKGKAMGAQLEKTRAHIPDWYGDSSVLNVAGKAQGPTHEFLKFIAQSPVRELIGHATDGWSAQGEGALSLDLHIPLDHPDQTKVKGRYEFAANSLSMAPGDPPATRLKGAVEFNEHGATSPGITGQFLGGAFNLRMDERDGGVVTAMQGSGDAAAFLRWLAVPIGERARGTMNYRATLMSRKQGTTGVIESNLQGVVLDAPPPFTKRAQEIWPLRVERLIDAEGKTRINASIGNVMALQALLRKEGVRTVVDRAGVSVGNVAVPKPEGSYIAAAVNVPLLNLDTLENWFQVTPGSNSTMPPVGTLDLRADALVAVGRQFNAVRMRAQLRGKIWRAEVSSKEAAGEVAWLPEGQGVVVARLKQLIHPQLAPGVAAANRPLRDLPSLDVVAERYVLDGNDLGRLELKAANEAGGWRIERAVLSMPAGTTNINGLWSRSSAGERTELDVHLRMSDIGTYLARFGYPGMVMGGEGELQGKASWAGSPFALDYPSLSGQLSVRAERGQFVKLKPGFGRLLGVLSLQSLPRRLTLDFKDVFSEGFAFDRIDGNASIDKGVMSTGDLGMLGPSATVAITGSIDLAKETQDLHVRVVPAVGGGVAAAGLAFVNPIAAAGVWVASRVFNDPFGQMLAHEYSVTGGWDDPQVEKLRGPPPPKAAAEVKPPQAGGTVPAPAAP